MGNANSSKKIAENLDVRKCIFGCGGEMRLSKLDKRMVWGCNKCFKDVPKLTGDYTKADKEREFPKVVKEDKK